MITHIIKQNETIEEIIMYYKVNFDDITSNNFHITDFKKLRSGMRLFIPLINEEITDILKISEPFVEEVIIEDKQFTPKEEKLLNIEEEQKEEIKKEEQATSTNNKIKVSNRYLEYYEKRGEIRRI